MGVNKFYQVFKDNGEHTYLFERQTQKVDIMCYPGEPILVRFTPDGKEFGDEIEIMPRASYTASVAIKGMTIMGGKHQIIAWFQSPTSKL